MAKLTPRRQRFVDEYLIDLNATQAAIRAGYSKKTAEQQACNLLKDVNVRQTIGLAQAERSQRTEITQDDVLNGLYSEATNFGKGAVHSARVTAWTQLGKHLGMFSDRVEHTGVNGEPLTLTVKVSYE